MISDYFRRKMVNHKFRETKVDLLPRRIILPDSSSSKSLLLLKVALDLEVDQRQQISKASRPQLVFTTKPIQ